MAQIARMPWYYRIFRTLGLVEAQEIRQLQNVESKPKAPKHGASWNNPYGARQTFSPGASMQAYSGHAYTHAAVSRASQDLAALPLKVIKGRGAKSQILDDSEVLDLFDQPNTFTDGFLFREQLITDLILSGNCWILVAGASKPESLFRLHPENVKIITDQTGVIGYEYNADGQRITYPVDRVIHGRNASWKNGAGGELYGTGAIESLAREINADINAQQLASQSSAQGRPDVLLSPVDDADIWGQERRREILDAYRGMSQKGGAMVLSGQVRVDPLNLTPRDLEFEASRTMARQSISAVIGVPPAILGLEAANYATARQQAINYWTNQTKRGKRISIMFTQIAKMFDSQLRIEHDYSGVEALQAQRSEQLGRIEMHILNGGMTAAQAYKYEGLEDAPIIDESSRETPAEDTADEEDQNARALYRLFDIVQKSKDDSQCDTECTHNSPNQAIEAHELRGSVGDKDPTNFPTDDENQAVSLSNSNTDRFPVESAEDLKENWPEIWGKGGNIEGNNQFNRLAPIANRRDKKAQTETEEMAIRKREAWAARHGQDFRIAGTVAQVKWLVVGDRGLRYMRNLIDAEKDKIRDKRKRDRYWSNWIERAVKPAERQIAKMTRVYLKDAAKRYAERVQGYVMESRSVGADYQRAIVDMGTLLGIADEVRIIDRTIGRTWRAVWTLQGNDVLDSIYDQLGETRPLDLVFGSRDLAAQLSQRSAQQIAESTGRSVLSVVERGLLDGLSVDQIAEKVQGATFFNPNRARRIAQTESTRAVNAASLQAYREAANLGIQLKKEWISSRDDRTRPEHLELDGQNIGIDQPFEIGSYKGMSPGEFGVGLMDVNCRCTIAPIVVR